MSLALASWRPPLGEHARDANAYAVWADTTAPDGTRPEHLRYWAEALRGAPVAVRLPVARHAPSSPARVVATVSAAFTARLRGILSSRPPLELTTLAALVVLVSRCTGQPDVVVSVASAGRSRPGQPPAAAVGPQSWLLRVALPDEWRFPQLLARLFYIRSGAQLHDSATRDAVVERLAAPVASAHGLVPEYGVTFAWSECPLDAGPGIEAADTEDAAGPGDDLACPAWSLDPTSAAHVRLSVCPTPGGGMTCEVTGDFSPSAGRRVLEQYVGLLEQIAASPRAPLPSYAILSRHDRTTLERQVRSLSPQPGGTTALDLFDTQVRMAPARAAVLEGDVVLTFADLDHWAGVVARRLRAAGVMPRDLVGVAAGAGATAVAAVLGVWKAGGAVVDLDLRAPAGDLAAAAAAHRISVVVREGGSIALPGSRVGVLDLSAVDDATEAPGREHPPAPGVCAGDLAFVVHGTAGGAGRLPVLLTHAAVANLATGLADGPYRPGGGGDAELVVCLDAAPGDPGFARQLAALLTGRTLHRPDVGLPTGSAALDALASGRADVVDACGRLVDSMPADAIAAALCERPSSAPVPVVLVDSCPPGEDAAHRLAVTGSCRVYSLYAPAEACFAAVMREGDGPARPVGGIVPLILDRYGQLAVSGTAGELLVGGPGVARGYYDRPELTEERFTSLRLGDGTIVRAFRTGRYARSIDGSTLELLGGVDEYVALLGYRIRPSVIEAALQRCPGVADVAVAVDDPASPDERLVAHIVPDGRPPTVADLSGWLRQALPGCVTPAEVVVVAALRQHDGRSGTAGPGASGQLRHASTAGPTSVAEPR